MHSKLNPLVAPFYPKNWQPTQQNGKGKGKQKMQMPPPPPPPPPPQHEQQFPPCYIVNPREGHPRTHTIIFLHGRDSTAEEFASELFESEASSPADGPPSTPGSQTLPNLLPTVKWVFPRAPILRSARFDTDMSQWFDMWSVENPSEGPDLQVPGLKQSIEYIHSVIDAEAALVSRSKVFLAGISQGFATALAAFYAPPKNWTSSGSGSERKLAGLIGIATWLPFARPLRNFWDWTQANSNTGKFVLNHGNTSGSLDHLEVPHKFMRLVGQFFTTFPGVEIEHLLREDPSTQEEFHFDQLASFEQLVAETQREEEEEEAQREEARQQANLRCQGRWEEHQRVEQEFKERKYKSTQEMGKTPMHLQHCEDDAVVPVGSVREMGDALRGIMWRVESQIYQSGGHWVNEPTGVDDFVKFVRRYM